MRAVRAGPALLSLLVAAAAQAQPPLPDRELRVGVFEEPPYAMKTAAGAWEGLSVDLWSEIAKRLGLKYRLTEIAPDALLDGLSRGSLDVAAAPLADTLERERVVDFTHAFLTSGLGIAVRRGSEAERWLALMRTLVSPTALRIYAVTALLLLFAGATAWLVERRRNPQFPREAVRGLGSGFWWAGVTTSGVGYGDKVPITVAGRAVAILWMMASLILVSVFVAHVTTRLILLDLGGVRGVASLQGSIVGTLEGSAAADYLRRERIPHRLYSSLDGAVRALERRDVEAVVFGRVTLAYLAERHHAIQLLPDTLESQRYAFGLPDSSPLRDSINRALREILSEPLWRDLRDHYLLGAAREQR